MEAKEAEMEAKQHQVRCEMSLSHTYPNPASPLDRETLLSQPAFPHTPLSPYPLIPLSPLDHEALLSQRVE